MSVQSFIANPESYCKSHVIQFSHQAAATSPAASGMQVLGTMNNWGGVWTAEEYGMVPGQFTSFKFSGDTDSITGAHVQIGKGKYAMHAIECITVAADQGVRFLPWKPNTVTYMTLDAAATSVYTGPLSGCSIFVGTSATGQVTMFHANRNNTPDAAGALKASMTTNVITSLPAPIPIQHSAIYQRDYSNLGFVFGKRSGNTWKFYAVDTELLPIGGGACKTTVKRL